MSKQSFYQDLLNEEKEVLDALDNIRGLLKYYGVEPEKNTTPQKSIVFDEPSNNIVASNNEYENAWTYKEKVLFILKELGGSALSSEVTKRVIEYDGTEKVKAGKAVRGNLSTLYSKGKIGAELIEEGTKRRYYLK